MTEIKGQPTLSPKGSNINEAAVKSVIKAVEKSLYESTLVGDFSHKPFNPMDLKTNLGLQGQYVLEENSYDPVSGLLKIDFKGKPTADDLITLAKAGIIDSSNALSQFKQLLPKQVGLSFSIEAKGEVTEDENGSTVFLNKGAEPQDFFNDLETTKKFKSILDRWNNGMPVTKKEFDDLYKSYKEEF